MTQETQEKQDDQGSEGTDQRTQTQIAKENVERCRRANEFFDNKCGLAEQFDWYDKKATRHKTWHIWLSLIIVASGALTTFIQIFVPNEDKFPDFTTIITAFLGAAVVICKGIERIWNYDNNWQNYRMAAEGMKRERRLYVYGNGPYEKLSDEAAFNLFHKRIDFILMTEQGNFWSSVREESEGPEFKSEDGAADPSGSTADAS